MTHADKCLELACKSGPCRTAARFILAHADEVPPGCPNRFELPDPRSQLHRFLEANEVYITPCAKAILAPLPSGGSVGAMQSFLQAQRLTLLESRIRHSIYVSVGPGPKEEPPPVVPVPVPVKSWVSFRVVMDATGQPVPNVALKVKLPNGSIDQRKTRPDGMIEIHEIDPGSCELTSELDFDRERLESTLDFVVMGETPEEQEPAEEQSSEQANGQAQGQSASGQAEESQQSAADESQPDRYLRSWDVEPSKEFRIADIEPHQVRTNETLESLADANDMTWQQLAKFNWDTAVPEQINEHLRDQVGCTHKTADGHNYMFNDADDPGIVFIPKKWEQKGLATEMTHTVRVRRLEYRAKVYLAVQLFFHEEKMEDLKVQFFSAGADGQAGDALDEKQRSDTNGIVQLDRPVEPGNYICRIEHQPDTLISSVDDRDEPFIVVLPIGRPYFDFEGDHEFEAEGESESGGSSESGS